MKVRLTALKTFTTNRQTNASLLDRNQRPYTRVTIQTDQHQKQWLSGFAYQGSPILNWKVGDEVDIEVTQNGQYLNFRLPRQEGGNQNFVIAELKRLATLIASQSGKIDELHRMVSDLVVEPSEPDGGPGVEDTQPEDIPF